MSIKCIKESLIEKGLFAISILLVIVIILLVVFVLIEAIPAFLNLGLIKFIFGSVWHPDNNEFCVFPMILGSIYVTCLALIFAVPLSLSCAIFLEEIASFKIKNLFKPIIQTLSDIPSVIYRFFLD